VYCPSLPRLREGKGKSLPAAGRGGAILNKPFFTLRLFLKKKVKVSAKSKTKKS